VFCFIEKIDNKEKLGAVSKSGANEIEKLHELLEKGTLLKKSLKVKSEEF